MNNYSLVAHTLVGDILTTVYPLDGTVMVVKEVEIESTSVHFK